MQLIISENIKERVQTQFIEVQPLLMCLNNLLKQLTWDFYTLLQALLWKLVDRESVSPFNIFSHTKSQPRDLFPHILRNSKIFKEEIKENSLYDWILQVEAQY